MMSVPRAAKAASLRHFRAVRGRALRLLPATGDLDDLVAAVAADRGRRITLLPYPLTGQAPTGMWIATDRADYVVHPVDASAAERAAIVCHEIAHMLLAHDPVGGDEQLAELAAVAAPDVSPAVARRFLARHGYGQDAEADAETLATIMVTHLGRRSERYAIGRDHVSDRLR